MSTSPGSILKDRAYCKKLYNKRIYIHLQILYVYAKSMYNYYKNTTTHQLAYFVFSKFFNKRFFFQYYTLFTSFRTNVYYINTKYCFFNSHFIPHFQEQQKDYKVMLFFII